MEPTNNPKKTGPTEVGLEFLTFGSEDTSLTDQLNYVMVIKNFVFTK